ncbi:MAG: ribosome biosis GTPase / thiamine phosphate phosphatase [Mycobacteriales bacterium]
MSPSYPNQPRYLTGRRHLRLAAGVPPLAPGPAGPIPDPLADLGWDARWDALVAGYRDGPGSLPGRIARADRGRAVVATAAGTVRAALLHPDATTGDWVLLDPDTADGTVRAVLPRRTALVRGGGRKDARGHLLAANVDVVLITVPLSSPPNAQQLDRLLAVAWSSGARPVIVLTKADLSRTAGTERDEVVELAAGTPVVLTSTVDGRGLAELRGQLAPGRTLALLGVSGAGKSSLVNMLAGADVADVAPIRPDGKGRHTTTARELTVLPGLGVLLDTPGLRGVQLWSADEGLEQTFGDVVELTRQCHFRDCQHRTEPGCAVLGAVEAGHLAPRRLESYLRLQRENTWLQRRYDARLRAEQRRRWRDEVYAARQRRHRGTR